MFEEDGCRGQGKFPGDGGDTADMQTGKLANEGQGPDFLSGNPEKAGEIESEDDFGDIPPRRPLLFRIVAFLTALSFLGFTAVTSLPQLKAPLADLVAKSSVLRKSMDERLLKSVVQIQVVSRGQGSPVLAGQKSGTGFNIDPKGLIVTNYHVVDGALNMSVTFPDGKVYRAARWSGRPEYDLAVITLKADGLPAAVLDLSARPAPRDTIRVVGNPLGYNNIVATGKVQQYLAVRGKQGEVFSIDAPIYPGNSGSPVLNRSGRVVGVVFATMRGGDSNESAVGLAVPIDDVLRLSEPLPDASSNRQ